MARKYYSRNHYKLVQDCGSRQADDGKAAERIADKSARKAILESVNQDIGPMSPENASAWIAELDRRLNAYSLGTNLSGK